MMEYVKNVMIAAVVVVMNVRKILIVNLFVV
jgi:hypothetical protein